MYLKLYFLIYIFMLIEKSKSDLMKNCSYEYTVDLTKSIQFENNSYLYNNNTLITPDLVNDYNFIIFNNGTRINNVETYKRGCICTIKKCIRFCSNKVLELYRNGSSSDLDKRFTKNVTLSNKKSIEKHLILDFYPIFGSVCESQEIVPENNWTLFEDGILWHHLTNKNLTQTEYCFDLNVSENNTLQFLIPVVCNKLKQTKLWIQIYGLIFSIPFFIVILFFNFLTNLSNVRGKCFITYLSLLTLTYTLLSLHKISGVPVRSIPCQIFGYIMYYTTISVFTWCCILCYDAWLTLTHIVSEQLSYKKYSVIGFSIPLLATSIKFISNCLTDLPKPLNCIFLNTNPVSVVLFYDLLGMIMVIHSMTLYIKILKYSWKTKREQQNYFREVQKEQMERLMVYFRILSLMGFEWIFVCVAHTLRSIYSKNTIMVLIGIYVSYFTAIFQGPMMFLIFICSSRVRSEIRKRFSKNISSTRSQFSRKNSTTEDYKRCSAHCCRLETNQIET